VSGFGCQENSLRSFLYLISNSSKASRTSTRTKRPMSSSKLPLCSNYPTLSRLPFDKLRPRASRGELVEGRIPMSVFFPLSSVICLLSSVLRLLSSALRLLSSALCPPSSVLCPLSSVICHLSSVLCLLSSALRLLSSVICHLSSALRLLSSALRLPSSVICPLSSVLCLLSSCPTPETRHLKPIPPMSENLKP